eukprot:1022271-Lingulodinium_polyedra.AAC.1
MAWSGTNRILHAPDMSPNLPWAWHHLAKAGTAFNPWADCAVKLGQDKRWVMELVSREGLWEVAVKVDL